MPSAFHDSRKEDRHRHIPHDDGGKRRGSEQQQGQAADEEDIPLLVVRPAEILELQRQHRHIANQQEAEQQHEKEQEKPKEEKTNRVRLNDKRKMTFKEKKEFEELEALIAKLEQEKADIEAALCSGTLSVDELTEKSKRLPELNDLIDEKTMRWLELSEIEG